MFSVRFSLVRIWQFVWALTGQFVDKPTCGQSNRGLVNSQTSQLADSDFFNDNYSVRSAIWL